MAALATGLAGYHWVMMKSPPAPARAPPPSMPYHRAFTLFLLLSEMHTHAQAVTQHDARCAPRPTTEKQQQQQQIIQ